MNRIDEKPDRFEREGSNIGTFREGHGYRALAGLQITTWVYFAPVGRKKWAEGARRTLGPGGRSGAEGREKDCGSITRCRIYGAVVSKGNVPVVFRGGRSTQLVELST